MACNRVKSRGQAMVGEDQKLFVCILGVVVVVGGWLVGYNLNQIESCMSSYRSRILKSMAKTLRDSVGWWWWWLVWYA